MNKREYLYFFLLQVWTDLHHTGFLPFVANPVSSMNHMIRYSHPPPQPQLLFIYFFLAWTVHNIRPFCQCEIWGLWNLCLQYLSLMSKSCYSYNKPSCSFHSAEGMNAGGFGNLLMSIEQPQGEYSVTISFLNLITTLVRVSASGVVCLWSQLQAVTVGKWNTAVSGIPWAVDLYE